MMRNRRKETWYFKNDASMEEVHLRTIPRNLSFSKRCFEKRKHDTYYATKKFQFFFRYNLYFLPNDPNQKESDLGAKWKWHFKKDLILFVTFRTFADVFFVTFADKDGSIDMCSLQQNGQSAGRVVVVEEWTVTKNPEKMWRETDSVRRHVWLLQYVWEHNDILSERSRRQSWLPPH